MSDNNGVEEFVVPKTDDTGMDEGRKPAEDKQEEAKVEPAADKVDTEKPAAEQDKPSEAKEPEKQEEDAKEGEKVEEKRESETDGASKTEA
jgi:hypothetical protein